MAERERLRETFGEDAALYDRMRPGYPAALFDDLAAGAGLTRGMRVLEIGPGTGQATRSLLDRGYRVTAVELSPTMAGVLASRCASYGDLLEIHIGPFENFCELVPSAAEPIAAIFAATAFHWVDPTVRLNRCAAFLSRGGVLATVATHHIEGGDTPFFNGVQECYERWDPATTPGLRLEPAERIPFAFADLGDSELFDAPSFTRYEWQQSYTTAEYRDLLMTYSGHRAMPPVDLEGLLGCITSLADTQFDGRITKRYMNELCMARRTAAG